MGGPGSSRWLHHHRKPLAEDSLRLDVEHLATQAARDPSTATGALLWRAGEPDPIPVGPDLPPDTVVVAGAAYEVASNYRGRYLGLSMVNQRPGQVGRSTTTLWLTELRTFPRSRRLLALCPVCGGRMAKAYLPPREWSDGFLCRRCAGVTAASNQREDKRVNHFRRNPEAAFEEIERRGSRMQLAMASLPSWLTGGGAHPGGKQFRGRLTDYVVEQGWVQVVPTAE